MATIVEALDYALDHDSERSIQMSEAEQVQFLEDQVVMHASSLSPYIRTLDAEALESLNSAETTGQKLAAILNLINSDGYKAHREVETKIKQEATHARLNSIVEAPAVKGSGSVSTSRRARSSERDDRIAGYNARLAPYIAAGHVKPSQIAAKTPGRDQFATSLEAIIESAREISRDQARDLTKAALTVGLASVIFAATEGASTPSSASRVPAARVVSTASHKVSPLPQKKPVALSALDISPLTTIQPPTSESLAIKLEDTSVVKDLHKLTVELLQTALAKQPAATPIETRPGVKPAVVTVQPEISTASNNSLTVQEVDNALDYYSALSPDKNNPDVQALASLAKSIAQNPRAVSSTLSELILSSFPKSSASYQGQAIPLVKKLFQSQDRELPAPAATAIAFVITSMQEQTMQPAQLSSELHEMTLAVNSMHETPLASANGASVAIKPSPKHAASTHSAAERPAAVGQTPKPVFHPITQAPAPEIAADQAISSEVTGQPWTVNTSVMGKTPYTAAQLDEALSGTGLAGLGQYFYDASEAEGVNPVFVTALAAVESKWGESAIAIGRNNLFGIDAYTSDPDAARYFPSMADCIQWYVHDLVSERLTPGGLHFGGGTSVTDTMKHWSTNSQEAANIVAVINENLLPKLAQPSQQPIPSQATNLETDERTAANSLSPAVAPAVQGTAAYASPDLDRLYPQLADDNGITAPAIMNGAAYDNQHDARVDNDIYTSVGDYEQTVSSSGCCLSSLEEALAQQGVNVPMQTLINLSVENGFRTADSGTLASFIPFIAHKYNVPVQAVDSVSGVVNALSQNTPDDIKVTVIINGHDDNPATPPTVSGHYYEIVRVIQDQYGEYHAVVNDPNSIGRSQRTYPLDELVQVSTSAYAIGSATNNPASSLVSHLETLEQNR